jgi:hypothetical protein
VHTEQKHVPKYSLHAHHIKELAGTSNLHLPSSYIWHFSESVCVNLGLSYRFPITRTERKVEAQIFVPRGSSSSAVPKFLGLKNPLYSENYYIPQKDAYADYIYQYLTQ